jgi:hypothetical protein
MQKEAIHPSRAAIADPAFSAVEYFLLKSMETV